MAYSNEPEKKYSEVGRKPKGTIARNSKDENFAMKGSRQYSWMLQRSTLRRVLKTFFEFKDRNVITGLINNCFDRDMMLDARSVWEVKDNKGMQLLYTSFLRKLY